MSVSSASPASAGPGAPAASLLPRSVVAAIPASAESRSFEGAKRHVPFRVAVDLDVEGAVGVGRGDRARLGRPGDGDVVVDAERRGVVVGVGVLFQEVLERGFRHAMPEIHFFGQVAGRIFHDVAGVLIAVPAPAQILLMRLVDGPIRHLLLDDFDDGLLPRVEPSGAPRISSPTGGSSAVSP